MMKSKMRVFCWFLSLFCAIRTEGFAVRGPAMPLVVQLGASVTLPCSVDTPLPLLELEVQWMREDSGTPVHLFQKGESRPESQSPAYSGRAQFFSEEISKGNFSLLLRNVTTEDKGLYKCVVHDKYESSETKVKIDIERLVVTGTYMPAFAYAGEDVVLNCSVDTHVPLKELQVEWIKKNGEILVLLFSEGENRPESQHERFRGRAEFFTEEIPKGNFSLKLRDVKSEDRGEFMCKVHTDGESVNATAWLQEQESCPSSDSVANEDDAEGESNRAVLLYCLQVSVPCILMSIAFAIWGYIESSIGEAYVGSTINLMRILVIFKVAPYTLPGTCYTRFTNKALQLENFVITTGVNSILLHKLLASAPDTGRKLLSGLMFAVVLFKHLFKKKQNIFSDAYYFEVNSTEMEILFLIITRSVYGFSVVFIIWFIQPILSDMQSSLNIALYQRRYLYLSFLPDVLIFILKRTLYLLVLIILSEKDKEYPALMSFIVFLYILNQIQQFNHRSNFPAVLHILVYAFGSAVLSILNSAALATEVFLKAENGERTVEDLRLIIFPLESFFLACWLVLQIYAYCMQNTGMKKELKLIFLSCKTKSQSSTSQQNQMPQELQEIVPLSPPEQSTAHTQEGSDDGHSEV